MTTHEVLRIERRFRGPDRSANGGYTAGLVGTSLQGADGSVPRVTLRMPPPLETDLGLSTSAHSAFLRTSDDTVVAEAEPVPDGVLDEAAIDPVQYDEARAAEASYRGLTNHPFPGCYTCGPDNEYGLRLRPGLLGDGRTACTWTPATTLADSDDLVSPVHLWAALDCPGGWSIDLEGRPSVLGQMTACIDARPQIGEPCVIMGRNLGESGRKTFTATTLYDSDGRILARARHTWIAVDPALFN
ncbi:hypothetical protein BWI15_15245 [Kribbella sp. ALI-6-A]|uniref:hypothetical protein n=1 Tax=Kribbella sp. ALI-6-A TaxID=1933817 RepID=UPI00097BE4E8|nr:hypothetical protein [Kribbella sp. ALI-6-A]ONI71532.1 hypothetical protein BWI15_15245 [Kribbella sp. ALI-6-A]